MEKTEFPKRLTPQGAESRERLLLGAINLISERGYAATSVDAICRHAGTAKTALYWHFKSKEGLLNAIIERVNDDWIREISQSTAGVGDPGERLDRLVAALRGIVEEKRQSRPQAEHVVDRLAQTALRARPLLDGPVTNLFDDLS